MSTNSILALYKTSLWNADSEVVLFKTSNSLKMPYSAEQRGIFQTEERRRIWVFEILIFSQIYQ